MLKILEPVLMHYSNFLINWLGMGVALPTHVAQRGLE